MPAFRLTLPRAALALALLAAAQLACGSGNDRAPGGNGGADPSVVAEDGVVDVAARITGFTLSAGSAPAGTVTFNVENVDVLPHDFTLTGDGVEAQTAALDPGEADTLTLDLAPGTYTYYCAVEGHKQAGMTGTFTVK